MKPDRNERAVFEPGPPVLHRAGVQTPDAVDPETPAGAVESAGRGCLRFDLDTTRCQALTTLSVQVLLWNPLAGRYFRGATREFAAEELAANPVPCLTLETRGASAVYLKVVSATAAVLDLDVYAVPW